MTLAIPPKRKFQAPALQSFQLAIREQTECSSSKGKKSILYHIYPQRYQSPSGDILKKREERPGWLGNPVHLLEDGSIIPQSCSTNYVPLEHTEEFLTFQSNQMFRLL